jgi:hypothetical protein
MAVETIAQNTNDRREKARPSDPFAPTDFPSGIIGLILPRWAAYRMPVQRAADHISASTFGQSLEILCDSGLCRTETE